MPAGATNMHCSIPDVKVGCCDILQMGMTCGNDQDCMSNAMVSMSPGEMNWFMSASQDMASSCPGLQTFEAGGAADDCSPGIESSHLHLAMMTAKRYQPKPVVLACADDDSCEATATCEADMPAGATNMHCSIPDVKVGCCDILQMGMTCGNDQDCMSNAMMSMSPGEMNWFMSASQDMASACPGLQTFEAGGAADDCSPGIESSHLQLAIMTAQRYQPKSGPLVPALIGFAVSAAVMISVVAVQKKRNSDDLYTPLTEETA
jgi:hypothetical protein